MSKGGYHHQVRKEGLVEKVLQAIIEQQQLTVCPICTFVLGKSSCLEENQAHFGFAKQTRVCYNCNVIWELNLVTPPDGAPRLCLCGRNDCHCRRSVFAPPDENGIALYPEADHLPATEPCHAGQDGEVRRAYASL